MLGPFERDPYVAVLAKGPERLGRLVVPNGRAPWHRVKKMNSTLSGLEPKMARQKETTDLPGDREMMCNTAHSLHCFGRVG